VYDVVGQLTRGQTPPPAPFLLGEGLPDSPFPIREAGALVRSWGVRFSFIEPTVSWIRRCKRLKPITAGTLEKKNSYEGKKVKLAKLQITNFLSGYNAGRPQITTYVLDIKPTT
jgi:hypothetical protein